MYVFQLFTLTILYISLAIKKIDVDSSKVFPSNTRLQLYEKRDSGTGVFLQIMQNF